MAKYQAQSAAGGAEPAFQRRANSVAIEILIHATKRIPDRWQCCRSQFCANGVAFPEITISAPNSRTIEAQVAAYNRSFSTRLIVEYLSYGRPIVTGRIWNVGGSCSVRWS